MVSALYKPLPSKKLNQRGENGATDLHPMASDFFFEFKKMCISVSQCLRHVQFTEEKKTCSHWNEKARPSVSDTKEVLSLPPDLLMKRVHIIDKRPCS